MRKASITSCRRTVAAVQNERHCAMYIAQERRRFANLQAVKSECYIVTRVASERAPGRVIQFQLVIAAQDWRSCRGLAC